MSNVNIERYSEYKNSNVEWLDKVPSHWKVTRNKDIFEERGSLSTSGDETLLTVSHITGVTRRSEKNVNMFMAETMAGYKLCKKGDLIINTMWAWMGALGTAKEDGICSPAYGVYKAKKYVPYNSRYFDYLYKTPNAITEMTRNSKGIVSSRLRLYPKDFFQIKTALPNVTEQTIIATYLDTKTTQIDRKINLLSKKATLYGKLKQSLINETVTRGLNKSVAMKDNKVKWIEEIPAHWKIKRFKEIFNKTHSGWTPDTNKSSNYDGENVWVTIRDMGKIHIHNSANKLSDQAIRDADIAITPKGSLLFSFKLSIGKIAFAGCDLYTNEAIITIENEKKLNLNYFYYTLPIFLILNAKENIYGAKLLNQGLIYNTPLLLPPQDEQNAIAEYLDEKTTHIDTIVTTINHQIAKLKELRKTLINDVVIGKIKVVDKTIEEETTA